MKETSQVVCLFLDNGPFVDLAVTYAKGFKHTYYNIPGWPSSFPIMNEAMIGHGLEGIEVVDSAFDVIDKCDLIICPDVYLGKWQTYFESKGKAVWGSRAGENMELYRDKFKKLLEKLGLNVNPWKAITGMDALREHLKTHKNQWVKPIKWRGIKESFFSPSYEKIEDVLTTLESDLGALKKYIRFTVEDQLEDCIELGIDPQTVDGDIPETTMCGIECKDKTYIATWQKYSDISEVITDPFEKLRPTLRNYGYRGPISTEVRVNPELEAYLIDITARYGSPPNELQQGMIKNLSEQAWAGANGDIVEPDWAAKYGAQIMLYSSRAEKHTLDIYFPKKNRDFLKFKNLIQQEDGTYTVLPQLICDTVIGSAIGFDDDLDKAIEKAKEVAKSVWAHDLECFPDYLDHAEEEIKKSQDLGISYFDKKVKDDSK